MTRIARRVTSHASLPPDSVPALAAAPAAPIMMPHCLPSLHSDATQCRCCLLCDIIGANIASIWFNSNLPIIYDDSVGTRMSVYQGCLVQVGNGIELEAVSLQFEPYRWGPCGVTWDSSRTVVVIKLRRTYALRPVRAARRHARPGPAPSLPRSHRQSSSCILLPVADSDLWSPRGATNEAGPSDPGYNR